MSSYAIGRPDNVPMDGRPELESPSATWQEHWFEHNQLIRLYQADQHAAIYLDDAVNRSEVSWLHRHISRVWDYAKTTYGDAFGPDPRIYSIHHAGRYGGGHPGYYYDSDHDHRNVSDCGLGSWREQDPDSVDYPSHEIAHVVESANNDTHGSPAFSVWRDSKWAEFFQYDLYVGLGMGGDAQRAYSRFRRQEDDFPRPGTHWFRNWFYPLWWECGHAAVMARFFRLLAQHFPKTGGMRYARQLNWGEYIHFSSGAAGTDLTRMATQAFGWRGEWDAELELARANFPLVTY